MFSIARPFPSRSPQPSRPPVARRGVSLRPPLGKSSRPWWMAWTPALLGALLAFLLIAAPSRAQDADPAAPAGIANASAAAQSIDAQTDGTPAPAAEPVAYLPQATADIIWLCLCAFLVFFMQAGFALVEAGLTRSKNACNIMMKNLLDFCFGALIFWAVGYALMFGEGGNSWVGWDKTLLFLGNANSGQDNLLSAKWIFQVVFAATAATIVSGAMAERTKLIGYVLYSILISAILYPISGHWIWGGGWLGATVADGGWGMRDFAGSTVVHSVGGWAALAGAIVVGPRIGKFRPDGTPVGIPGHNMPLAALGVFILFFGWFGFNPGSTLLAIDGVSHIAVTTTLAGAAGGVAALICTWIGFGKPELSMTLNGVLAGLVGITAPCASVSTVGAVIIGIVAGVLVYFSCLFVERVLKVDDPVGAISVHGVCGAWGTLAVGLFGQRAIDLPYWDDAGAIQDGLFYGGGMHQFLVQLCGVGVVFGFAFGLGMILFTLIKFTVGLRVTDEEQLEGLDIGEHGMHAYPDFAVESELQPGYFVVPERRMARASTATPRA